MATNQQILDFDSIEAEQETITVRARLDGVRREWELRTDADTLLGLRAVRLFEMSAQLQEALSAGEADDDAAEADARLEALLTKLEARTLALVVALFAQSGYGAEMDAAAVRRALPRHEMRWAVARAFFTRRTASSSTPPAAGPSRPLDLEREQTAQGTSMSTSTTGKSKRHARRRRADVTTRLMTGRLTQ